MQESTHTLGAAAVAAEPTSWIWWVCSAAARASILLWVLALTLWTTRWWWRTTTDTQAFLHRRGLHLPPYLPRGDAAAPRGSVGGGGRPHVAEAPDRSEG